MIYADYNATAPLRPEAMDVMQEVLGSGAANPSSVHAAGRKARAFVEKARRQLGGVIGARAEDIVFTSGGTEALALAIMGSVAALEHRATLLVSAIEHEAAIRAATLSGAAVETLPVGADGRLDLDDLSSRLGSWDSSVKGLPLLVLMAANNETGILQPVSEASARVREAGGFAICDAVQILGRIGVSTAMLGADYLVFSAHKTGGPQGVGALWCRPGAPLRAVLGGGGQERGLRSGTENVAGIAAFGAAAEKAADELRAYDGLRAGRDAMEARLKAEGGVTVFGEGSLRLAGVSCFARRGFRGETQVIAMDLAGICVSSGAACSSGKVRGSHVLAAMGADKTLAESAIRTSFGWGTHPEDFARVADAWLAAARKSVLREPV